MADMYVEHRRHTVLVLVGPVLRLCDLVLPFCQAGNGRFAGCSELGIVRILGQQDCDLVTRLAGDRQVDQQFIEHQGNVATALRQKLVIRRRRFDPRIRQDDEVRAARVAPDGHRDPVGARCHRRAAKPGK